MLNETYFLNVNSEAESLSSQEALSAKLIEMLRELFVYSFTMMEGLR
jgi:hypothetical protein